MPFSTQGSQTQQGSEGKKKKRPGWLIPFPTSREDLLTPFEGPFAYLLERTPWQATRGVGTALAGLGTSPAATTLFPKSTVGGAYQSLTGLVEAPYGLYKSTKQVGAGDTARLFLQGLAQNYKDRYGSNWQHEAKKNGLFNLMDALTVLGVGARGAALAGAASRLSEADKGITLGSLWKESSRPGLISREGDVLSRELSFQPKTGEAITSTQPYSRSPLRRFTQEALTDKLAQGPAWDLPFGQRLDLGALAKVPIFGARSRITRANATQLARTMDRTLGSVIGEEALNSGKLRDAGRSRLFWEAQLGTRDNASLRRLRDALQGEYTTKTLDDIADPEFKNWLFGAKQAGFGPQLIKRLDAAIAYDPAKSGGRYEAAMGALRQAADLSEQTMKDAHGFTSLTQDLKRVGDHINGLDPKSPEFAKAVAQRMALRRELSQKSADLETMFGNRRGLLSDWLHTKTVDAPERTAWDEVLTNIMGEDQARQLIAVTDQMANKIRPEDPASFWKDKIGMPSMDSAAMFRQRPGVDTLFQFGEKSLTEGGGFYSPLQKAVEGLPPRMQAGQLQAMLRKAIPQEEFYNSGLDMYFDALDKNTMISTQEFKDLLANPLNAYNLREVVRNNTEEAFHAGLDTVYGEGKHQLGEGNYISREPKPGEYHEVTFEVPGPGRDVPFKGKGYDHWTRDNVAVHFRFHDFVDADGTRKILVEEIQSDWANQFREEQKAGRVYNRKPTPDQQAEYDRLRASIADTEAEISQLKQRQEILDREIRSGTADAEAENEWYQNQESLDHLGQDWWELSQGFDWLNDEYGLGNIPPPPLGRGTSAASSYLNSPARWLMRYADENNVDEIVLIGRQQQLLRNAKALDPRAWQTLKGGPAEDVTAWLAEHPPQGRSYISYEDDIPKVFARELGVEGVKTDSAYTGEYRVSFDRSPGSQAAGQMPGTVFKVTDEVRANARKSHSLYQRQPDWSALPKGAVELFAGGKSRIHIFADGDASTWIHELGHVALHDLGSEDRAIVEAHFGGGKDIAEWTEMQHESFARSFEQYVRDGEAPNQQLRDVFAKLSAWIRQVWQREQRVNQDIPPEVKDVFSRLFQEDKIYMPHRATAPDLMGGRTTRAMPRAQRDIGDRTVSRIPLFKKNTLALVRSGMVNDDPRVLMEHANRVVALARANQLREHVLAMGEPLLPGDVPNFETQYVIKKSGRGVDKPLFDALESADQPQEIANSIKEYIDSYLTDEPAKWEQWKGEGQLYVVDKKAVDMLFKDVTGKAPGAATKPASNTGKVIDAVLDSVRGLLLFANPGFYSANILGNSGMLMLKDPLAAKFLPWSMKQAITAAKRPENADPLWQRIAVEMGRGPMSGTLSRPPKILSPEPGTEGNLAGRIGERVSGGLGFYGQRSGRVIDDSFRVAAWRMEAQKLGYKTDAQVKKLFEDASVKRPFRPAEKGEPRGEALKAQTKAERDFNAIRDGAEQLMLDFDSITPTERTWLQRAIFLYPFLKASTKYPFMLAGERPITSGLLFGATGQGEQYAQQPQALGPRPDLPLWLSGYARGPGGYFNVGSISNLTMVPGLLQTLQGGWGGPSAVGVQRPIDYLNPLVQTILDLARQQNAFGRDASYGAILKSEAPLPGPLRYPLQKPSTHFQDRDFLNALLRSLRFYPTRINEGVPPSGGG